MAAEDLSVGVKGYKSSKLSMLFLVHHELFVFHLFGVARVQKYRKSFIIFPISFSCVLVLLSSSLC